MHNREHPGRVAILLATHNGVQFLDEQLASLDAQTCPAIDVHVSDDRSTDDTMALLRVWETRWTKGSFSIVEGPGKGFAENFRSLICASDIDAPFCAFSDQDDVWEPDKLERAIGWMGAQAEAPKLFCSRTRLVTEDGRANGYSKLFSREPSFRNALVQSIAGGNTMVFNRAAHRLVALASSRSSFVSHDWWAYMLVSGAGGEVCYTPEPLVRYRQHRSNTVGANTSLTARLSRLKRMMSGRFSSWTDENFKGLEANRDLLTQEAKADFDRFRSVRSGSAYARIRAVHDAGVYRQSAAGDIALYLAAMLGRL